MFDKNINALVTVLASVICASCVVRIIGYAINMMFNPDDTKQYIKQIKNILIVVAVTLLISSYSIWGVISSYYSTWT